MRDLHTLVFHSLSEQIVVIDDAGAIIDVNNAWIQFGIDNGQQPGFVWTGRNYLRVLAAASARGDSDAETALRGVLGVIEGRTDTCELEYPCHTPTEQRWFMMSACNLTDESLRLFAISHIDITRRKLAEELAEHLAMHDPLTGLANRRYFTRILNREFGRSKQYRSPISLIVVDVDHFKKYNDEFGHLAGDHCLMELSEIMLSVTRRPSDLAARLGGDEFAVLLGNTGAAHSDALAESIVKAFSDLRIGFGESEHMTVSAGVTSVIALHEDEEWLIHEADKALYCAKRAGRNRFARAEPVAGDTTG